MAFANRVHQGVEGQNETQVFYIIILKKNCFAFLAKKNDERKNVFNFQHHLYVKINWVEKILKSNSLG